MNDPVIVRRGANTIGLPPDASSAPQSRRAPLRTLMIVAGATLISWSPLAAQDTADVVPADSIAERLERVEEQLALLRQQLATQAASAVQTKSRASLEIGGRILTNAFSNSRRVNNADVPQFVRPDTASALPLGGAGMAIRQSTLSLAVTSPGVLGGALSATGEVDFYGGQQPSSGGRHFPLLRLRTASATLAWSHASLLVGQEAPLIAGPNPVSVASVGTPGFVGAGNLWLWLPQVRLTAETGGRFRVGLQGAVLAPASGDPNGLFDTDADLAERSRRPFLQGRARARWGADDRAAELGVGIHRGWLAAAGDSNRTSEAMSVDAILPLMGWLEIRGEAYRGRLLRGLGGGGIGQNFGAPASVGAVAPVLRDKGGWAQLNLRPGAGVTLGGGCGVDDPDDKDRPLRLRNRACEGHVIWRPGAMLFGVEYRRLTTDYVVDSFSDDHWNVGIGFEF